MGQPVCLKDSHYLKIELTQGTETSEYLQEEKINNDSPSSGERTGKSPNHDCSNAAVGL